MDIKIGRKKYKVKAVSQFKGKTYIAQIDYEKKTITVAKRGGISGRLLPIAVMMQALYHEIVHGILHDMKHSLNDDEKFVDAFAKRLLSIQTGFEMEDRRIKNGFDMVPQRVKGLRELRKKVPRSARVKKAQAGKHRADSLRRGTA